MARYFTLLTILFLAACKVERTPKPLKPEEAARAVIGDARAQLEKALVDGDADHMATLFTHDAVYSRPGLGELATPRLIRDHARAFFRDTAVTSVSFESDGVDILPGGIAHEIGRYTQIVQPITDSVRVLKGQYVIRWRRGPEASWRIERLLLTGS